MITVENAHEIDSFDPANVESMIDYYFASRIRGDQKWKEVLQDPTEWSNRMKYSIDEHDKWNFLEYKNDGFKDGSDRWVSIWVKIEYNGRTDSGTNEVEVKKLNDS